MSAPVSPSQPKISETRQSAPFNEGDVVRIKDNDHLGLHRVDECEWFDRTSRGVPSYWLCECTAIRDPVDWSKYPPGTTGIITGSMWRGSADHLESDALPEPSDVARG